MPLLIGSRPVSSLKINQLDSLVKSVRALPAIDMLDSERSPVKSEQAFLGLPEEILIVEKKAAGAVEYVGTIDADEGVMCYLTTDEDTILLQVTREGFEKQLSEIFSRLKSTQNIQVKFASCRLTPQTRKYLKKILKVLYQLSADYLITIVAQQLNSQLQHIAFSLQTGALMSIDPTLTLKNKYYRQMVPLSNLLKLEPARSEAIEEQLSNLLAPLFNLVGMLDPKLFKMLILMAVYGQLAQQVQSEQLELGTPAEYLLRSMGSYGYDSSLPDFHPNLVKIFLSCGSLLHSGKISDLSVLKETIADFLGITFAEMSLYFDSLVQFIQSPRNYQYVVGLFVKTLSASLEHANELFAKKEFAQAIAVIEDALNDINVIDVADGANDIFSSLLCFPNTASQKETLIIVCARSCLKIAQCYFSLYEGDKADHHLLSAQDAAEKARRILKEWLPSDTQHLAELNLLLEQIEYAQAIGKANVLLQQGRDEFKAQEYRAACSSFQEAAKIFERYSEKREYLFEAAKCYNNIVKCLPKLGASPEQIKAAAEKAIASYVAVSCSYFDFYKETSLRVHRETTVECAEKAYGTAKHYLSGQEREAAIKQIGLLVLQQGRDLYQKQKFDRALPFFIKAAALLEQCSDQEARTELGKSYFNIAICNYNFGCYIAKTAEKKLEYYTIAVDYAGKAEQLLAQCFPADHATVKLAKEKHVEFCVAQEKAREAALQEAAPEDAVAKAPVLQC